MSPHRFHHLRVPSVLAVTAALMLGIASPAGAQTQQDGLVNVNIEDVNVQVPVAVAAAICDVNVNVLAGQLDTGQPNCPSDADAVATRNTGGGNDGTTQNGLVNLNVQDVNVQVPVAVAAALCDINVNVLSRQVDLGSANCPADATSIASPGPGQGNGQQNRQ